MTNDERDKKITRTLILTEQTHEVLFGKDGRRGMKAEFDFVKGIVYFFVFIVLPVVGIYVVFCKG